MQYRGDKIGRILWCNSCLGQLKNNWICNTFGVTLEYGGKQDRGVGQGQDIRWAQNKGDEQNLEKCGWQPKNHENCPKTLEEKSYIICFTCQEGQGQDWVGGKLEDRREP